MTGTLTGCCRSGTIWEKYPSYSMIDISYPLLSTTVLVSKLNSALVGVCSSILDMISVSCVLLIYSSASCVSGCTSGCSPLPQADMTSNSKTNITFFHSLPSLSYNFYGSFLPNSYARLENSDRFVIAGVPHPTPRIIPISVRFR